MSKKAGRAGAAFLDASKDDPQTIAALQQARHRLKDHAAALKTLSLAQGAALERFREITRGIVSSGEKKIEAAHAESQEAWRLEAEKWQATYGEPYPDSDEGLLRLASRAGLSPDYILAGAWKLREIVPIIEGYLRRLRDERDTKDDTPKKTKKNLRPMNVESLACVRLFKNDRKNDPSTTMKSVVEDYVNENGGSEDGIMRRLNDNSADWK